MSSQSKKVMTAVEIQTAFLDWLASEVAKEGDDGSDAFKRAEARARAQATRAGDEH